MRSSIKAYPSKIWLLAIAFVDPEFTQPLIERCDLYNLMGKPESALKDCNRALERMPEAARAREARGLVFLKTGHLTGALYARAWFEQKDGYKEGAATDLKEAIKLRTTIATDAQAYGLPSQH